MCHGIFHKDISSDNHSIKIENSNSIDVYHENIISKVPWEKYDTDIEILNIFSWELETDEKFDLVYDDRLEVISEEKHDEQMKKILPLKQWYSGFAIANDNKKIFPQEYHRGFPGIVRVKIHKAIKVSPRDKNAIENLNT